MKTIPFSGALNLASKTFSTNVNTNKVLASTVYTSLDKTVSPLLIKTETAKCKVMIEGIIIDLIRIFYPKMESSNEDLMIAVKDLYEDYYVQFTNNFIASELTPEILMIDLDDVLLQWIKYSLKNNHGYGADINKLTINRLNTLWISFKSLWAIQVVHYLYDKFKPSKYEYLKLLRQVKSEIFGSSIKLEDYLIHNLK